MSIPKWNASAWAYYTVITIAGWIAIGRSIVSVEELATPNWYWPLLVIPLVLLRNTFIQLPNCDGRICPSGVFVVYGAVVWGPGPAALLAAVEATLNSFSQSAEFAWRIVFNMAALSLAIFVATAVGSWVVPMDPALSLHLLFCRAILIALLYYVLNMGIVLGMMALAGGRRALSAARSALLWSWAEYAVAGVFAGVLGLLRGTEALALVLGSAVLHLTQKTLKHYFAVLKNREELLEELRATHLATLETLATAIEAKDPVTHGHVLRVQYLAELLAKRMKIEGEDLESMRIGALLHDIGKLAIPEYILYNCGEEDPDDVRKLQSHAVIGAEILEHSRLSQDVKMFVKHHHERYDGTGYPYGLAGEEIPVGARVLAVVDMFDKLRHPRSGGALSAENALRVLEGEAGKGLDPGIVSVFSELKEVLGDYAENRVARVSDNDIEAADLQRASFVDDFHLSHKEAKALFTLGRDVHATNDLDEILSKLLSTISEFVPIVGSRLFLSNRTTHELELVHSSGLSWIDAEHWPNQLWFARLQKWLDRGTEYIEHGTPLDNFAALEDEVSPARLRTVAMFPLPLGGSERGMLILCHTDPFSYTQDHKHIIKTLLEHVVDTIASARTYQQYQLESITDALTGLLNGRALLQKGPRLIAETIMSGRPGCVVMIDLNGFKQVNDSLGHHEGDKLLVDVARCLKNHVRSGDLIVRNGGDEFVLILPDISPSIMARRMKDLCEAACALWPSVAAAGAGGISYGSAWFPNEGDSLHELMIAADNRMYKDKRSKKDLLASAAR